MEFIPSEILAEVFELKGWETFKGDAVNVHKIFYELYQKNPELLGNFKFIIRTNPYCETLEDLFTLFQLAGILSHSNPDYLEYRINRDRLKEFLAKNREPLKELKGLDGLDTLHE